MRYAFIHAVALLAALILAGPAFADGSQTEVVATSDGKTYTVIPNGQTGSIVVDHQTGKTTQLINVKRHQHKTTASERQSRKLNRHRR